MSVLTDVKIMPLDRFLVRSSRADEMSVSKAVFKLFMGGRFSSSVAMPVLSFTVKLTNPFVDANPRHDLAVDEAAIKPRRKIACLLILTAKIENEKYL